MIYRFNFLILQIQTGAKLLIWLSIFLFLSNAASAQKLSHIAQSRTAQTVGTITEIYKAPNDHSRNYTLPTNAQMTTYGYTVVGLVLANAISNNSYFIYRLLTPAERMSKNYDYTEISYLGKTFTFGFAVNTHAYKVGDKLIIEYNPYDLSNALPILERPCFEKYELADTTEGIITGFEGNLCFVNYKVYNPSDSMDVKIVTRGRYLSIAMFDTLNIRKNCVYKIIFNRQSNKMEVLFNTIIDSTHQDLNKQLYSALNRITNGKLVDAIRDLNKCIELDSQNKSFYYYQLAKAKEDQREYKAAALYFTKYIEVKPTDTRGYIRRAIAYIGMGDFEAAQKDVKQLFDLNPLNEEAYYLQGEIYYHNKEYQKAIDSYSDAINYSNWSNIQLYYYKRALATKKLYGKKNNEYQIDYTNAKAEHRKNKNAKLYSKDTHEGSLHTNKQSAYVTVTSDNTLAFNNYAYQSNMQGRLHVPYTIGNGVPKTFDKTFSLNHSNHKRSFALGIFSLEVGGYKSFYGRVEMGMVLSNGNGPPFKLRSVLGYNIKFIENNVMILRPEIGLTYFNRTIELGTIDFSATTPVNIMGKNFKYHTSKYSYTDNIKVNFCENVLSFSPALNLWLWPYSSRLVVRVGMGYNFVFSQHYSVNFQSNNNHLRKRLDDLNMQFSNTNGTNNFFSYNGFFINAGIGIRF